MNGVSSKKHIYYLLSNPENPEPPLISDIDKQKYGQI